MKLGKLIVISGPSGVGKSTVRSKLIDNNDNYWYSISMTTRSPRENEVNGIDYYFVTKDVFVENIKNNNFIEYAEVYEGIFYGTPKDKIEEKLNNGVNVVLEIDVDGALNVRKLYNDSLLIFIAPPSLEELEARLRLRKTDSEENIIKRLNKAKYELSFKDKYDHVIVNDDINTTVSKIINFVEK